MGVWNGKRREAGNAKETFEGFRNGRRELNGVVKAVRRRWPRDAFATFHHWIAVRCSSVIRYREKTLIGSTDSDSGPVARAITPFVAIVLLDRIPPSLHSLWTQ